MHQLVIAGGIGAARGAMGRALIPFTVFAVLGLRWIWMGITRDIPIDVFGTPRYAPPWLYVIAGLVCQAPLVLYVLFILRPGYACY